MTPTKKQLRSLERLPHGGEYVTWPEGVVLAVVEHPDRPRTVLVLRDGRKVESGTQRIKLG